MGWQQEQDRITLEGRLYLSPPEMVFAQLKQLSETIDVVDWDTRKKLDVSLFERNDPLINLGLACYCINSDVFKALYNHSIEPPRDNADSLNKRNLRLGCLSNQTLRATKFLCDFPQDLIGQQEVFRILSKADSSELEALVSNPKVANSLLVEIFSMTGHMMPLLSDERRATVVRYAAKNERINTIENEDSMPDMVHYRIHQAIWRFLEVAPVNYKWAYVVYEVLGNLDPDRLALPEHIDPVLDRWKALKDQEEDEVKGIFTSLPMSELKDHEKDEEDEEDEEDEVEGNFTSLPMSEELRCYITALYGQDVGSPTAEDVVQRCAYYSHGKINAEEMEAGYEREGSVYAFAASFNLNIIRSEERRKLFEEDHLGYHSNAKLYLKNLASAKRRFPYIGEPFRDDLREEWGLDRDQIPARLERIETATTALQAQTAAQSSEFQSLKLSAFVLAIVLAIIYGFGKIAS